MKNQFLKTTSFLLCALPLSQINDALGGVNQESKKPNVLIIMCDQLNYKALSCYGGKVNTPNIDRIANEGIKFTNAFCTTPYCSPSRASIVTGLYPHQHGIIQNLGGQQKEGITIQDQTTEKILSEIGYKTHHYGKWHLEGNSSYLPYYPDQYDYGYQYKKEMFDAGYTVLKDDGQDWMNFYGQYWPVDVSKVMLGKREHLDSLWKNQGFKDFALKMGRLRLKQEDWIDDKVANKTINRIRESGNNNQPFMLTCSFIWPHDPNFVPSPYYEMFDPESLNLPLQNLPDERFEKSWSRQMVKGYGNEGLKEFLRIYYASVKYLDDRVGKILKALEEQGILDETIILFTADHGDMMGNHGMVWKSNESFYEEIVHIPFIIRYPKTFKPGISTIQTSLVDIMPTILSLTGGKNDKEIAGIDLVPFLTGKKNVSKARQYSFCERIAPNPNRGRKVVASMKGAFMVRNEKYKLIVYPDGGLYLYNLIDDPHESQNLASVSKYVKIKTELSDALTKWLEETGWKGVEVKF